MSDRMRSMQRNEFYEEIKEIIFVPCGEGTTANECYCKEPCFIYFIQAITE
jgi:hypothetical protein